ncbi:IS4 family transposase [Cellvibrio sp. OA-2007]|uniref:IS4 family transposase n=1 Tax=Cellvibrio sp. OA-2007 TaxID=529823 RepID=UPI0007849F5F|nr:IS4 family transposase [Cellvibrio sp. OA-2007]
MFSITTFHELLKGLPRSTFDQLVDKRKADKFSKGFGHWNHLVAMLYGQLSEAPGLRPLEAGFNAQVSHHYHLGTGPIKRTTLSDANAKRSDSVFHATAAWLMGQLSGKLRRESVELMYLLDSTSLTLKGREFDRWTRDSRTQNTQGIKVHVLFEAASQTPQWHSFSAANVNDVELARSVPLQKGALYVFDKGYCDYRWWHDIDQAGAYFVTRFKRNASLRTVEIRGIPEEATQVVLSDEIVQFKNRHPGGGRKNPYSRSLRCVTIARPDKQTPLVFATNDLHSPALEIAQRYKERWGIELFFKWVKQHLKIKKFLGRSENAVRIQVLTALIAYLLLALYRMRHALEVTMWECLALVRATLFQRQQSESYYKRKRRREAEIASRQLRLI